MDIYRISLLVLNLASTSLVAYALTAPMSDYGASPRLTGSRPSGSERAEQLGASQPTPETKTHFFRAGELPRPREQEPALPKPPDVAHLRLIGLLKDGDSDVALMQMLDRTMHRLRKDDLIDGWRVREIGRRSVSLTKSGVAATVHLDPASAPVVHK